MLHAHLRVAAVIPVYRAQYLHECLASVFAQTRPPDEVIVVDDGSPDDEALRRALQAFAGRLRVLHQENRGAGAARNAAIRITDAPLIAFLDADDLWEPRFLERQLRLLEARPDAVLAYANGRVSGAGPLAGTLFMDTAPSSGEVSVEALLAQRCTVLTSSVVARRQALVDAGLFDETLRRGQDFDLWVRVAFRWPRFVYTTDPLVIRRVHGHNLSGDRTAEIGRAVAVLEGLARKLTLDAAESRTLCRRIKALDSELETEYGKRSLESGNVRDAGARFSRAAANGHWKVRAVSYGLRIAPELTRRAYVFMRGRPARQRRSTCQTA